jgi:hypothetical protein
VVDADEHAPVDDLGDDAMRPGARWTDVDEGGVDV